MTHTPFEPINSNRGRDTDSYKPKQHTPTHRQTYIYAHSNSHTAAHTKHTNRSHSKHVHTHTHTHTLRWLEPTFSLNSLGQTEVSPDLENVIACGTHTLTHTQYVYCVMFLFHNVIYERCEVSGERERERERERQ